MDTLNTRVADYFGHRATAGTFGIEIETEGNFPGIIAAEGWDVKTDGSLRQGLEFVSKPTKDVRSAVTKLSLSLVEAQANLNPSYRCSTHLHYNFQQKTFKDVCGIMIAWAALEPLFLQQMPPGRDGSIYCMSCYDTGDLPMFFERFCEDIRQNFRHGFRGRNKYASLNILRLQDLGTVEFRIFPTSMDPQEIGTWADWIVNLDNLTQKYGAKDFLSLVRWIERNPEEACLTVFGKLPFDKDTTSQLADLGCKTAYEMARVLNRTMAKGQPAARKKSIADMDVAAEPVEF